MQPEGRERRKEHSLDEEFQGLAARSLREGVSVDELELRLRNPDGTAGPDAKRVNELRAGANKKLLAMAGLTPEQIATILEAAKEGAEAPALVPGAEPGAEPEAAPQTPEKVLTADQRTDLLFRLEARFTSDTQRYKDIQWRKVAAALEAASDQALYGLFQMEENGHEVGVTKVEKGGRKGFRFDSCSEESPAHIRDVDYFQAERIANKDWGMPLMSPEVFEELRSAGIIINKNSWDHLKTAADPETKENPGGLSLCGYSNGLYRDLARNHNHNGGFPLLAMGPGSLVFEFLYSIPGNDLQVLSPIVLPANFC